MARDVTDVTSSVSGTAIWTGEYPRAQAFSRKARGGASILPKHDAVNSERKANDDATGPEIDSESESAALLSHSADYE